MGIENEQIVLVLNKSWLAVGQTTVEKAFISICKGATQALNIEYDMNHDGTPNFSKAIKMEAFSWYDWVKLPIFKWHLTINTPKIKVRVPHVIITKNYNKMPKKRLALTLANVRTIYNDTCCYSGKKLTKSESTQDHIIPLSRGGKDEWSNIALASKDLNNKKGNRLNHEIGYNLLTQPKVPTSQPFCSFIKYPKHPDWVWFLMK